MTSEEFQVLVKKRKNSGPEDELAAQLTAAGITYERQFMFCPGRKYRADFCLKQISTLVEIDGGIFAQPKLKVSKRGVPYMGKTQHSTGRGIQISMERQNEAAILGWWILRFMPEQITDGTALKTIHRMLGIGNGKSWNPGHAR